MTTVTSKTLPPQPYTKRRSRLLARSLLILATMAMALTGQVLLEEGILPWGAALLIGAAVVAANVLPTRLSAAASSRGESAWTISLVLILTALAAVLRVFRIESIPPGLWLDETDLALSAIRILQGQRPPPFGVGHIEVPNLYRYYLVLYYWLLGASYLTVKLPAIVAGALTTPALYALGRRFLRTELALGVAFLWATSRWSINVSRWGHVATLIPLLACLAFWLIWKGSEASTGRWRYWIPAGLVLALSQYTYQSSRVIPLVSLLFLLFWAWSHPGWLKAAWPSLLAATLIFVALYTPLAATYLQDPRLYSERAQAISIFNPLFTQEPLLALRDNVVAYVQAFHYRGDLNPRHNLVGVPTLDAFTATTFALGLFYAVRRWRQPSAFLLLSWFGAFLAGGLLSQGAPNTFRIYGLAPAVLLLAGLTLEGAWQEWESSGPVLARALWPTSRWVLAGLTAMGLAWAADSNVRTFFLQQAVQPGAWKDFNVASTRVGMALHDLRDGWAVYLDRRFFGWSPIDVINPDLEYERLLLPEHILMPPAVPEGQGVALVLGHYTTEATPLLQDRYPNTSILTLRNELGELLGTVVQIPPQDLQRGLRVVYGPLEVTTGEGRQGTGEVATLQPETSTSRPPGTGLPYPVHWRGSLRLAEAGPYRFRLSAPANSTSVSLGGQTTFGHGEVRDVWLPAGLLSLHVERIVEQPEGDQLLLEWQPPGADGWHRIPADLLYPIEVQDNGLLAIAYEGDRFTGPPQIVYHDPLMLAENLGTQATYAQRWIGQLTVPEPGLVRLATFSDDGSRLYLDGKLLVDNWGLHGAVQEVAELALAAGPHSIDLRYFDYGGSYWFAAQWTQPAGDPLRPLAEASLRWDSATVQSVLTTPEPGPSAGIPIVTGGELPLARVEGADPRWPEPVRDQNFLGKLLKIHDDVYDSGLGVFSPAELVFEFAAGFTQFRGAVGIDRDTIGDSVAGARIVGDGQILWSSGPLRINEPGLPFEVDVNGVRELRLEIVEDGAGDGRPDAVDWVNMELRP